MYLEAVVALCLALCHITAGRQVNLTIQVRSLQNKEASEEIKHIFHIDCDVQNRNYKVTSSAIESL